MTILGIDPGCDETAWCVYMDGRPVRFAKEPNETVCDRLAVDSFVDGDIDLIAIETITSYGMAVGAEVFRTCEWVGEFRRIAKDRQAKYRQVFRAEVKMHLCGNMRAKDANIIQALKDKLGPKGTKANKGATYGISGDVWQALAVAITAAETEAT